MIKLSYSPFQKQVLPTQTREKKWIFARWCYVSLQYCTCYHEVQMLSVFWSIDSRSIPTSTGVGEDVINPCFANQEWGCKAAARLSQVYSLPWSWAPGSHGCLNQHGQSKLSPANMTRFPPRSKPKENNKSLWSHISSYGVGRDGLYPFLFCGDWGTAVSSVGLAREKVR